MAGAAELHEPSVVDHAVHNRRGELVVGEHGAPCQRRQPTLPGFGYFCSSFLSTGTSLSP